MTLGGLLRRNQRPIRSVRLDQASGHVQLTSKLRRQQETSWLLGGHERTVTGSKVKLRVLCGTCSTFSLCGSCGLCGLRETLDPWMNRRSETGCSASLVAGEHSRATWSRISGSSLRRCDARSSGTAKREPRSGSSVTVSTTSFEVDQRRDGCCSASCNGATGGRVTVERESDMHFFGVPPQVDHFRARSSACTTGARICVPGAARREICPLVRAEHHAHVAQGTGGQAQEACSADRSSAYGSVGDRFGGCHPRCRHRNTHPLGRCWSPAVWGCLPGQSVYP
jgi:hypothetical protein